MSWCTGSYSRKCNTHGATVIAKENKELDGVQDQERDIVKLPHEVVAELLGSDLLNKSVGHGS